ncbi:MAG: hypothetical protein MJB57_10175 [Gemmatimonadetes bacterium]|nr:hypothetical protein [Gemmatimonadota bacterium]
MRRNLLFATLLVVGFGLATSSPASAQTLFGAEAVFGSDTDAGLGVRIDLPLGTTAPLSFQGGFNFFFPDVGDYWEVNGNIWYEIPTSGGGNVAPYVGGGLNIGRASVSGFSDTEAGLNLGGGAKFIFANTIPFVEARFVIGGAEQFVFGGGVLFGGF